MSVVEVAPPGVLGVPGASGAERADERGAVGGRPSVRAVSVPAVSVPVAAARAVAARAALALAEQRTGVRRVAAERDWARSWVATAALSTVPDVPPGTVPDGAHRSDAVHPAGGPEPLHGPDLPVAAQVRHLLPGGVLRRGRTVVVSGSQSLLLALVARASGQGAWTAAVGMPTLGLVAAAEAGVDLDRLALVPAPGPDAPAVLAALLDGMDVVLVGPHATLLDADRRRLQARARERGAVLVATCAWPGAHVVLDASSEGWSGARAGEGWLRRQRVAVERSGRAGTTPGRFAVELPLGAGADAAFVAPVGRAPVVVRPVRVVGEAGEAAAGVARVVPGPTDGAGVASAGLSVVDPSGAPVAPEPVPVPGGAACAPARPDLRLVG